MQSITYNGQTTLPNEEFLQLVEMRKHVHENAKNPYVLFYYRGDYGKSRGVRYDYYYFTESQRIHDLEDDLQKTRQELQDLKDKEDEKMPPRIEKIGVRNGIVIGLIIAASVVSFLIGLSF